MNPTSTKGESRRGSVAALARASTRGLISTSQASETWAVSKSTATSRLHRLVRAGWLIPIRKGFFFIRPLEAGELTTVDDPWILAAQAFSPCYIGGWSAAEHWGLTEQLFHSTFVVTAGSARSTRVTLLGNEFKVVRASRQRVASVAPSWRGTTRVAVSDPARTLADAMNAPAWVGGVRHLTEILAAYRRSEHWSPPRLLAALAAHPKGAAYKRLGYLVEATLGGDESIVQAALAHRSSGVINLDPRLKATGKIVSRWGLRLNVALGAEDAS